MTHLDDRSAADIFRDAPDRHVDVGDGTAALRTVGSGPDVLFVHGWPVNGATFRRLLPHLVEHVTCHVVDLPGCGSSRYSADSTLSVDNHIMAVRKVVDALGVEQIAVVGHDSGGMIARHALAGDQRLRAMGLIDTEQPKGLNWRFRSFLAARRLPGMSSALGYVAGRPRLRRNGFVLGDAFNDRSLLDGEFDEFFLRPLAVDTAAREAAVAILRSFDRRYVDQLAELHSRIDVPVRLVWGRDDKFFPLEWAREMVDTFADATLDVVDGAGLFSHEERPAEVAASLLKVLPTR